VSVRPAGEARKIVTVVFSDVTDSTGLGQERDPEVVRRLVTRYFDEMESVLERHGGIVEKFIGDAVMAVFGVPHVHEDDALRAVRAAAEMRDALVRLNEEFQRAWGVTIEARTGVSTGEVIAGDPGHGQAFVSGDVVNTASRLEEAARPGEILIAESTYRLVHAAVVVDEVPPLTLKGKRAPVRARRLLEVRPAVPGWSRRLDSPLVGRERELERLREIFERTRETAEPELVTLMAPAGVGKSRLTSEFLSGAGTAATVITGRCLPYGEGITFWPIAAVMRDAAGISERDPPTEAWRKLSELLPAEGEATLIAERLAPLLGAGAGRPGIQETFWGVRKLLEHLAARSPLVVVFDDIQWGEDTFLDLLEYLADWIRAPGVLFLCLARPELLEVRPGWMHGKRNASLITLAPLSEAEVAGLIENLVGEAELAVQARARIAEVAEGNPLFVEETLRMLVDDALLARRNGSWTVAGDLSTITIPPTIQALLTARLDRLDAEERAVVERASVVGRIFWWGAVSELSPPEARPSVIRHLHSLTRKELIHPDQSGLDREVSFRFAHILIRDAAYQAIPKTERADLHERLAAWIEREARELSGEYEEILGYHLEQATRLLLELGPANERTDALGRRAAAVLTPAGRRAFARGDMPAAAKLLSRAVSLLSEHGRERAELLPQLAFALFETGDFASLERVVEETTETAAASGDPRLEAYAVIIDLWVRSGWEPAGWADLAEREATTAIEVFEAAGDDRGLGKAWALLGLVHVERAEFAAARAAWERAADHASRAGDRRDELESLSWVPLTAWAGPMPAAEGLRRCREVLERAEGDEKVMASALIAQAAFEAGLGHFEDARALIERGRTLLQEVALTVWLGGPVAQFAGWVELLAGDAERAERELRWGYDKLTEIGELSWLSTVAAILAEALWSQGRDDEAEHFARASEDSSGAEDRYSHAMWRSVQAKIHARRGAAAEAERLAGEAVTFADATDLLHLRWHVRMSLAEVLGAAGRGEEARPVLEEAIELAELKGNAVGAGRARSLLEGLDAPP
jgi:class 3 adenylate cyclase/tetratricopeptide (TPR) repeat protein